MFEKRAYDLFMQQLVKGTSHLSLGMEAIAAGFGAAMRERRLHVRHLPRPRPHARARRADDASARRAARPRQRPDGRQGRLDAPHERRARDDGLLRDHRRAPDDRQRRGVVRAVPRLGPGRRLLLRRRHHQHRRVPRGAQLRRRVSSCRSSSSARTTSTWSTPRSPTSRPSRTRPPTAPRPTASSRSSSTATTPTRCTSPRVAGPRPGALGRGPVAGRGADLPPRRALAGRPGQVPAEPARWRRGRRTTRSRSTASGWCGSGCRATSSTPSTRGARAPSTRPPRRADRGRAPLTRERVHRCLG